MFRFDAELRPLILTLALRYSELPIVTVGAIALSILVTSLHNTSCPNLTTSTCCLIVRRLVVQKTVQRLDNIPDR